ncbi:MAG: terminase large subunit domain-containing protein [Bryobacteraceae bacterium]
MDGLFPATGPLRRELYAKHLEFFRLGRVHSERLFCAGNRCGKTVAGAYETTLDLTGLYPEWWEGRRFSCAIEAWVAGQTSNTTRDIVQLELMGKFGAFGTGMIPADCILGSSLKGRPAHAVDTVSVKHASGGVSLLGFKSYKEGASAFQGTAKHVIWFDEEPDFATYVEANVRTMMVPVCPEGGIVMLTFTPLNGWSEVVESFLGVKPQA